MNSELLFKSDYVEVSPTVARFGNTSYQIANIGSVRMVSIRRTKVGAVFLILLGALVFIAAAFFLTLQVQKVGYSFANPHHAIATGLVLCALITMGFGVMWSTKYPLFEHRLYLKTSSGDFQVLNSKNREYIANIRQAIERAFDIPR